MTHDPNDERRDYDRWSELAADLGAEMVDREREENRAAADDLARAALAGIDLVARFGAAVGRPVLLGVRGVGPVRGLVGAAGPGWVTVHDGERETVVLLGALVSATGLGSSAMLVAGTLADRWGVTHVLRRHARDRSTVRVVLDTGDALTGTLDVVGSDHVDLAEHDLGESRRRGAVRSRRVVPLAAIATVSRDRQV